MLFANRDWRNQEIWGFAICGFNQKKLWIWDLRTCTPKKFAKLWQRNERKILQIFDLWTKKRKFCVPTFALILFFLSSHSLPIFHSYLYPCFPYSQRSILAAALDFDISEWQVNWFNYLLLASEYPSYFTYWNKVRLRQSPDIYDLMVIRYRTVLYMVLYIRMNSNGRFSVLVSYDP